MNRSREPRRLTVVATVGLVAAIIAAGCEGAPTQPSASQLVITPTMMVLKVGESGTFAAAASSTPIVWTIEPVDVAQITPLGDVTASHAGSAVVTAAVAGSTATATLNVVPALDGDWSGQAQTVSIRRISGGGPFSGCCLDTFTYVWHVAQLHDQLMLTDSAEFTDVSFAGAISMSGSVQAQGQRTSVDPGQYPINMTWTAQLTSGSNVLTGSSAKTVSYTTLFGPQIVEYDYSFTLARK